MGSLLSSGSVYFQPDSALCHPDVKRQIVPNFFPTYEADPEATMFEVLSRIKMWSCGRLAAIMGRREWLALVEQIRGDR
jgi:hypothetical protein